MNNDQLHRKTKFFIYIQNTPLHNNIFMLLVFAVLNYIKALNYIRMANRKTICPSSPYIR